MWADVLTKEMRLLEMLEKVLMKNDMDLPSVLINEVKAVDGEVRMENIRNQEAVKIQINEEEVYLYNVSLLAS